MLYCNELASIGQISRHCRRGGARLALALACVVGAVGCRSDQISVPASAAYLITVVSGDNQRAPAGSVLSEALTVRVVDADGVPAKGTRVVFRVVRGAAAGSALLDSVSLAGVDGAASVRLQVGSTSDTTLVTAFVWPLISHAVTMRAMATAAPVLATAPTAIAANDTITLRGRGLAIGGVTPTVLFGTERANALVASGDTVLRVIVPPCLEAGPVALRVSWGNVTTNALSATYVGSSVSVALAPYQAMRVPGAALASCLRLPANATYLVVPQFATIGSGDSLVAWRLGSTPAASGADVRATAIPSVPTNRVQQQFDAFLRARERQIAPQAAAEAAMRRAQGVSFQAAVAPVPPAVRAFRVVAALDGSRFADVGARLRYAGTHLWVYTDTTERAFSDAEYRSLGVLIDKDLYPIGGAAFGTESDVDNNGHVIVLFTSVVNAMVDRADCGQKGFVTGFFFGNDLLPSSANSNKGEIYYSMVPDSTARYSCEHTGAYVMKTVPSTFVHEMQHMISFNQHVLARGGESEVTWLNEGLSHLAEELGAQLFEARFPYPTGRTSPEQIFPDSAGPFITANLLDAYVYLSFPRGHSVTSYIEAGSLEDRGASWLFLRWLTEQKGNGILSRLVQTSKTGIGNVEFATGETFGAMFGDFSLALFTDSLPGVPRAAVAPRYRFGRRNLRALMARLAIADGFSNPWPLPLFDLRTGGSLSTGMMPGTMTHTLSRASTASAITLRFSRPDLSAFSSRDGAQVSIFRLPP